MQVDKESVRVVMAEVRKAVEGVCQGRGLSLQTLGCSFDPGVGKINLRLGLVSSTVNGRPAEQAEFERFCALYYLKPEHYRARIAVLGEDYEIVGFKPSASKRPIVVERIPDKKRYVLPATAVGALIAQEDKACFAASMASRMGAFRRGRRED